MKWCPTNYKLAPNNLKNGAQGCFDNFYSRLFISKFFVEAVFISHLTFILSHIRNSSPTLLQEMHSLVFRIHNEWK